MSALERTCKKARAQFTSPPFKAALEPRRVPADSLQTQTSDWELLLGNEPAPSEVRLGFPP